jgi:uncharacterized protein with NRDE domain
MCTLFLAFEKHKDYPIILIENRDEFFARKSTKPHWWEKNNFFAGQDLEKGGTWLGHHKNGNWGVVTNYRDLTKPILGERSRGDLIPTIIGEEYTAANAAQFLIENGKDFGPFNLLYSIGNEVFCYSSELNKIEKLNPGIYGLSNAYIDTPWFKIEKGKKEFEKLINQKDLNKEAIFSIMLDEEKAPDNQLPNTGLPLEIEKLVSSLFINSKDYGTHCTTLLTKDKSGKINFKERRFIE